MKKKNTTINDIADALNLTPSTVSRALNGNKRISQRTIDLVKAKAVELNYQPNHIASRLRLNRTHTLGVIVPRINRSFFSNIIHGIECIATDNGFSIIICQTNETYEQEVVSVETLIRNQVDGVLMSLSATTKMLDHIQHIQARGIPIIQFDRVDMLIKGSKVINDDANASYCLVKHLIEQGYKNIMHFAGPLNLNIYKHRLNGYKQALEEAGIAIRKEFILKNVITKKEGYKACKRIFQDSNLNQKPDAIFAASDFSALGSFIALKEMGICIPEEVGVAGYANEPFTEWISPSMTSVEQYSEEIGRMATKLLIEEISNKKAANIMQTITVNPRLIVRESTCRSKR